MSVPELCNIVKFSTGFRVNDEGYIVEDRTKPVLHWHGTAISMVIQSIFDNVELISINILNERLTADGRVLLYALDQVFSYTPDIIHLSLGTKNLKYFPAFRQVIKRANRQNILIVCSGRDNELLVLPACMKGVVTVKPNEDISDYSIKIKKGVFYAPARMPAQYHTACIPYYEHAIGSSISAAYITPHLALTKYEKELTKNTEIINEFKKVLED